MLIVRVQLPDVKVQLLDVKVQLPDDKVQLPDDKVQLPGCQSSVARMSIFFTGSSPVFQVTIFR